MNRKGMEIAIDTLVVIIIGVVLLGGGIFMVTKFVDHGETQMDLINEQLADEVRQGSFKEGKLVAVFNNRATVQRGQDALFLLGIANTKAIVGAPNQFTISIVYSDRSPVNDVLQEYVIISDNLFLHEFRQGPVTIEPGKDHFTNIMFLPPKDMPTGEYLFDIVTCYNNGDSTDDPSSSLSTCMNPLPDQYGQKLRLYLTVS
jgi:hypothetical protein